MIRIPNTVDELLLEATRENRREFQSAILAAVRMGLRVLTKSQVAAALIVEARRLGRTKESVR